MPQVRGVVRITADEIDAKKWRNTATDKDVSTAAHPLALPQPNQFVALGPTMRLENSI